MKRALTHGSPATTRARAGIAGLALALLGVGAHGSAGTPAQWLQAIETEIGDARCSRDAACRTLPIGGLACGGPQDWRAWSTEASHAARLKSLAARHARAVRDEDHRLGRVSICQVRPEPAVHCEAQRCVLSRDEPLLPPSSR